MNAIIKGKLLEGKNKVNPLNETKGGVKDIVRKVLQQTKSFQIVKEGKQYKLLKGDNVYKIQGFEGFGWIERFYEVEGIPIGILRFTSKGKLYIFVGNETISINGHREFDRIPRFGIEKGRIVGRGIINFKKIIGGEETQVVEEIKIEIKLPN